MCAIMDANFLLPDVEKADSKCIVCDFSEKLKVVKGFPSFRNVLADIILYLHRSQILQEYSDSVQLALCLELAQPFVELNKEMTIQVYHVCDLHVSHCLAYAKYLSTKFLSRVMRLEMNHLERRIEPSFVTTI